MPPRLPPLTLLALVVCASCTPMPSDPYFIQGGSSAQIQRTEVANATQVAALPITQSANERAFNVSLTEAALPPQLTRLANDNQSTAIANDLLAQRATGEALDRSSSITATVAALKVLESDTQKRIAENNAAIANSGIVTDGSKYLCMGVVGVFVFGFLVLVCVTIRQYQLWLDELRRVKGNRMWRQLAIDYRPRIAAPIGYKPEPPRNLSAESRLRAACKVYVDACVTLAQGGVKHPFSRPTALTYGLVTNPATGEVWQSGHDVIIKTLTGAGVFANTGKGGRTEFAVGWDYDRFKREFDITPLPPMDEGPIPAAKIMLAGSQLTQVRSFAG